MSEFVTEAVLTRLEASREYEGQRQVFATLREAVHLLTLLAMLPPCRLHIDRAVEFLAAYAGEDVAEDVPGVIALVKKHLESAK